MFWLCGIWNILAQMFAFADQGFSKCKSLYLSEREKCYGRHTHTLIHAFNPHKKAEKSVIHSRISENTLQEMICNPHEFILEVGTIVRFGR